MLTSPHPTSSLSPSPFLKYYSPFSSLTSSSHFLWSTFSQNPSISNTNPNNTIHAMKPSTTFFLLAALLAVAALCGGARPDSSTTNRGAKPQNGNNKNKGGGGGGAGSTGPGGFFGPGGGFGIPGVGSNGWGNGIIPGGGGGGYGAGFGGPKGGFGKGGTFSKPTLCKEKGRCFNKKLSCPKKCFHSFSRSGKNYGGGGGGGGCNIDCKNCVASCVA